MNDNQKSISFKGIIFLYFQLFINKYNVMISTTSACAFQIYKSIIQEIKFLF